MSGMDIETREERAEAQEAISSLLRFIGDGDPVTRCIWHESLDLALGSAVHEGIRCGHCDEVREVSDPDLALLRDWLDHLGDKVEGLIAIREAEQAA